MTPGPWRWRKDQNRTCYHVESRSADGLHWLVAEVSGRGPEANAANAVLIAAAPELYDALRGLLEAGRDGGVLLPTDPSAEKARAALAKAEGGAL